jgi:hypothetical protein
MHIGAVISSEMRIRLRPEKPQDYVADEAEFTPVGKPVFAIGSRHNKVE